MKINLKNKSVFYQFLLLELVVIIVSISIVFFKQIKLFPSNWEWQFKSYYNLNEAYKEFLFILGGFSLVNILSFLSYRKLTPKVNLICPTCEEVHPVDEKNKNVVCKKCGSKLVPLKGFYDKKKK